MDERVYERMATTSNALQINGSKTVRRSSFLGKLMKIKVKQFKKKIN
jgi:hypothetical protein